MSTIKKFRSTALENEKKREENEAAVLREKKFQEEMRFEKEKLQQKLKKLSLFQKLWSFVSTHVRAFATFSPTAKSTYLGQILT